MTALSFSFQSTLKLTYGIVYLQHCNQSLS